MQSQEQHTPGPWRQTGHDIERTNGQAIATILRDSWQTKQEQVANAARIVACVNACEGIANPEEYIRPFRAGALEVEVERDQLREQNKELVEALKYWLPDETWMGSHYPSADPTCKAPWEAFYKACAILAKIT